MLKRVISVFVFIAIMLSTSAISYSQEAGFVDVEDFFSSSISKNWEIICSNTKNVAKVNTENQTFELNKNEDSSGVRLSYVIPDKISSGMVTFEFSFYMNGTANKAIQLQGINGKGSNILMYTLSQGGRAAIRNEDSGYTNVSNDILSKGKKYSFKTVIDFDATEENISTYINSVESSVKKGFQASATAIDLKKISFYIPTLSNYTGAGIAIGDFRVYTDTPDICDIIESYNKLVFGNNGIVLESYTPLLMDENEVSIVWSTSNPDVITKDGIVSRSFDEDKKVLITAELSKNNIKATKRFALTVPKSNRNDEKTNSGFENVALITAGTDYWSGDKKPLVWGNPNKVSTPDGVNFTAMIDSNEKYSGEYSLKLGSETEPARIMVGQNITGLSPEKTYRVSGYVKTENYNSFSLSSSGPVIRVQVARTSNYFSTTSVEPTSDWTYVDTIFSPGADTIRIDCNFTSGCGYAWFDDIKLEEYVPVRSVTLSKQNIVMEPDEICDLTAQLYPVHRADAIINWSSSDEDIATVDENGKVTAIGEKSGRAAISATVTENICTPSSGGKKLASQTIEGICIVEVKEPISDAEVTSINLNKTSLSLNLGSYGAELLATATPSCARDNIIWYSLNSDVADVVDGMVIPKTAGQTMVYAKSGNVVAGCSVTVNEAVGAPVLTDKTYEVTENFDDIVKGTEYPKLLFDMSEIERIRETARNPLYEKAYLTMANTAEKCLEKSDWVHPLRAAGGRVLNKYVCDLSMVGYINKDMRYINKAIEFMMNSSDAYTAEDYDRMNGDIGLGDGAHAYAVGYDWLYPFMTDEQRKQIEDEMDDLIGELYALSAKEESIALPAVSSNHASVSAGGMGLAALVRGNSEAVELAKNITVEYYKTSADPGGFSFEGIGYYCYGLLGAATFNAAVERAEGVDLLEEVPTYRSTLDAITYYTRPSGRGYITIGDSGDGISPAGGVMYLISKYKNSTALWNYLRLVGDNGDRTYGNGSEGNGASIPYVLIFADTSIQPQKPDVFPHGVGYKSGFISMRDGWENDSSLMTFTSSAVPHRGHNQRDENSFTFYAYGEDFLIDPGYDPTETSSHNGVLINGSGQSVPGNKYDIYGRVENCILYDEIGYVKGDASKTYPSQPDTDGVYREVLYRGGSNPYMVVRDDIRMDDGINANIQVLYQTDKKNKVILNQNADGIKIIGAKNGAVMKIICPFTDTIMRTGTYEGRKLVGGRGEYVVSNYSETIEALTNTKGNAHIVSLIMTSQKESDFPQVEVLGTAKNGSIKLTFADGRTDYISLTDDDIKVRGIKVEWGNDGTYADVEIGASVNEDITDGAICMVKYNGEVLADIEITDFELNGYSRKHTLSFGNFDGEKSLLFWQKGNLIPLFDRVDAE